MSQLFNSRFNIASISHWFPYFLITLISDFVKNTNHLNFWTFLFNNLTLFDLLCLLRHRTREWYRLNLSFTRHIQAIQMIEITAWAWHGYCADSMSFPTFGIRLRRGDYTNGLRRWIWWKHLDIAKSILWVEISHCFREANYWISRWGIHLCWNV